MSEQQGPRMPPGSGGARIVDESVFRILVEMEMHKAQRLRYWVSLVYLAVDEASRAIAELVAPAIRATDVVTATDSGSVALLLIDAEDTSLPAIMQRITTNLGSVPWSAGGSCYPKTAGTADELRDQAESLMLQAHIEGGQRFYLPS